MSAIYRDTLRAELEKASLAANDRLDAERQKLAHMSADDTQRRAQGLRIQAAAVEANRCLTALFNVDKS